MYHVVGFAIGAALVASFFVWCFVVVVVEPVRRRRRRRVKAKRPGYIDLRTRYR
jgi:hypothetical protein